MPLLTCCIRAVPDSLILELADLLRRQPSLTIAALESALGSEALHEPQHLRDGAVVETVMRLVMHAIYGAPQKQGSTGLGEHAAALADAAAPAGRSGLPMLARMSVPIRPRPNGLDVAARRSVIGFSPSSTVGVIPKDWRTSVDALG